MQSGTVEDVETGQDVPAKEPAQSRQGTHLAGWRGRVQAGRRGRPEPETAMEQNRHASYLAARRLRASTTEAQSQTRSEEPAEACVAVQVSSWACCRCYRLRVTVKSSATPAKIPSTPEETRGQAKTASCIASRNERAPYQARKGSATINKAFIRQAIATSPRSKAAKARVAPHPGHSTWRYSYTGQAG